MKKPTLKIKTIALLLAGAGLSTLPYHVQANPNGGQVVAGNATIKQESATKIGIVQTTAKAIIDWQKYSIGANEHVQYYQPSASSVTLNRVVGQDPSQILGRLTANGQVFLVNPNGIYFGKNAQIDVAGLVASTHNIRNEDFMAGKYDFNIPGKPGTAVINEGTIRIADTGIAAFVAPSVANRGVIVAKLGKVALAAASGFTLDFHGDDLLTFLVNDEVAQTAFDIEGKQLTSFVENSGRIEAQGGYVLLTAKAAESAIHGVINHSGVIEATTVGTENGEIILHAGKGSLKVSGTLDASASQGGDGGFIETSGGHVDISPETIITTAAPLGKTGKWLIDPTDYIIAASGGHITGSLLSAYLALNHVEIQTLATGNSGSGDIYVRDAVTWNTLNKLTLTAHRNINIEAAISANGGGSVKLRADSLGTGAGTVVFGPSGRIRVNNASVGIYYNPVSYN
ncbi:MAG: filamentous hemagglutinin N-terminal domain-containing protein, partial [Betaproteobacteria bacterium]|nr:filamentous hemagglutinin N-terminal domain-containing protein [Betaproteobacteria bacterium]